MTATLTPTSDSDIKMELWLPANWNGKFEAVGNGAFNGSIAEPALAAAVRRGSAAAFDTNHVGNSGGVRARPSREGDRLRLARGPRDDGGVESDHQRVLRERPGAFVLQRAVRRADARRLKEAQRFPADFDGIVAGAPGLDWTGRASQAVHVAQATAKGEAARLSAADQKLLHDTVLDACDVLDGVRDGVIENPTRCRFDPSILTCTGPKAPSCLTEAQVRTATLMYASLVNGRTKREISGAQPGSELGWTDMGWTASARATGRDQFRYLVFKNAAWDVEAFDASADVARAEEADGNTINALDPNLQAFAARGGKLIQYHGWNDPQISPGNSTQYYSRVVSALGAQTVDRAYRLFMVPGMAHCSGGEGPDRFDMLGALERWVEHGAPPDRVIASKAKDGKVERTRPLCPYPQVAVYSGAGSTDEAASFVCKAQ